MFSKYDEIAKIIRNYIEDSLVKPTMNVTTLNNYFIETYKISIPNIDLTNLSNKIFAAKKLRIDYQNKAQNSFPKDEKLSLELKEQEASLLEETGKVREFGYALASKICIMLYKGPLTRDTMKELKDHNYDGTYGHPTMMLMYTLYNENERLKKSNARKDEQLNAFYQQYKQQFYTLQEFKIKNSSLTLENKNLLDIQENLQQTLSNQSAALQSINQSVQALRMNSFEEEIQPPKRI